VFWAYGALEEDGVEVELEGGGGTPRDEGPGDGNGLGGAVPAHQQIPLGFRQGNEVNMFEQMREEGRAEGGEGGVQLDNRVWASTWHRISGGPRQERTVVYRPRPFVHNISTPWCQVGYEKSRSADVRRPGGRAGIDGTTGSSRIGGATGSVSGEVSLEFVPGWEVEEVRGGVGALGLVGGLGEQSDLLQHRRPLSQ